MSDRKVGFTWLIGDIVVDGLEEICQEWETYFPSSFDMRISQTANEKVLHNELLHRFYLFILKVL